MKAEVKRDSIQQITVESNEILRFEAVFPEHNMSRTVEVAWPATDAEVKAGVELAAAEVKAIVDAEAAKLEKDNTARSAIGLGGTTLEYEVTV